MATRMDRVAGAAAAGGPASGVNYFAAPGEYRGAANITPGAGDLTFEDEPYDIGLREGSSGGSAPVTSPGTPESAATLGSFGRGLGIAGQVLGEPSLSLAGGALGAAAAGQQGNFGPAVGMGVGMMTGNPGLAAAASLGTQMAQGTFQATPSNLGGLAGGLVGGPVGSAVGSYLGGVAQDALANNPDVAASLANAVNTATFGLVDPMDAMMGLTGNFGAAPGPDTGGLTGAPDVGTIGGGLSDSEGDTSYANGGMVGLTRRYADGGPLLSIGYAQGGSVQMGPAPGSTSVTAQVNRILRDPRMKQEIAVRAQALMDSGELTIDEVQLMARVAEAAMYNQQLYPQLRQFVAEQGMTPLPAAYDPAVVVKIMAIARVLQEMQPATPPGAVPPMDQAQVSPPPGMKQGGLINGPGTGRSDSIGTVNRSSGEPVSVANNEYIIPEHVVRIKGREFFDKLLARYENAPKEQA